MQRPRLLSCQPVERLNTFLSHEQALARQYSDLRHNRLLFRHARRVSGITGLAITKLDTLSGIETLRICTAYKYNGEIIESFPANLNLLAKCEPVYEEMPGWTEDITGVRNLNDLPENARHYIERITQLTGIPMSIFSVGPDREQTVVVRGIYG